MPRAERREQILGAAASAFVQTGFDGTSMDDVARAAGVTRLIVYRIFESKHELYSAVLDQVVGDLREQFESHPAGDSVAVRVVRVARAHPDAFRLLWRHAANEPEFEKLAGMFRSVVFEYAEGLIAPSLSDMTMRRWAARAIVNYLYEGICLWLDVGAARRDAEVARALTEGARAMVLAWAQPGG